MENNIRKIVITGSNRGLGFTLVQELLKLQKIGQHPSHKIIMTARNEQSGLLSKDKILQQYPKANLDFFQLDIEQSVSIDSFIKNYQLKHGNVDILVNNAAIGPSLRGDRSMESNLKTIAINFFGTVELTEKMVPLLTQDGKIISITSQLGKLSHHPVSGQKLLSDPNLTKETLFKYAEMWMQQAKQNRFVDWDGDSYNFTKAMVNAYNRFVGVKLMKNDQQIFSCCPGWCNTKLGGKGAPLSPEQGVQQPLYLMFGIPFKADSSINGSFFSHGSKQSSKF